MPAIMLDRGRFALVDDGDFERVKGHRWTTNRPHVTASGLEFWYAQAHIDGKTVRMHRFIMDAPSGTQVDHINGDGLDNRRSNLRLCSHAGNNRNRHVKNAPARGVLRLSSGRWSARIGVDGRNVGLGTYDSKEAAARAYDAAAVRLHGEFGSLNLADDTAVLPCSLAETDGTHSGACAAAAIDSFSTYLVRPGSERNGANALVESLRRWAQEQLRSGYPDWTVSYALSAVSCGMRQSEPVLFPAVYAG
ncbi:MAG: HNH endonuclease [Chloroflexota bacterium]|nr:HNH endonuclease [Chloroflexota bacterium]